MNSAKVQLALLESGHIIVYCNSREYRISEGGGPNPPVGVPTLNSLDRMSLRLCVEAHLSAEATNVRQHSGVGSPTVRRFKFTESLMKV